MKKFFKWTGITIGSLIVLIILALIIAPFFIDIQKFKPTIEQQVTKAIGRDFTIGGDLELSLFPWAGMSFSDVHLGNPEGFTEKEFVSIKSFDVKVKFMPLLSKDIQVKRFVINGPRIVLEKAQDGTANWEGIGAAEPADAQVEEEEVSQDTGGGLPITGLTVAEFIVSEGELLYIDNTSGMRKEVKDLNIELRDVSLERPISLAFSAIIDNRPFSIEGEAGPIGSEPGKGAMTINLAFKAMDMLSMTLEGSATDVASNPQFDLSISIDPFPPRDLMKAVVPDFELNTMDPEVFKSIALAMKVKGSTENVDISNGTIELDQSRMTFSASARDFEKPDVTFKMDLDKIDADRYMPPTVEEKEEQAAQATAAPSEKQEDTDYGPLRKLVLDTAVNIGELTIKGARVKDIQVRITAKDGVFNIDPLSLKTYEGSVSGTAVMDVSKDIPAVQADMEVKGLQLRKAINGLLPDLVLNTKDPDVLKTLSLKVKMKGTTENISISEGTLELDQSKMTFSASAKDFEKPDITFKMDLDKIDADRYLPPPVEGEAETAQAAPASTEKQEKTDYTPLRKLVLDSAVNIGELTIKGISISDIQATVKGKDGIFNLSPFSLNAYEGSIAGNGALDVSKDSPATKAGMNIKNLQVRGLVNDLIKKDIIEGAATGTVNISMSGDTAELIKKTLNGKGEISLKNGAVVGIDLTAMVNNLKTAFGKAEAVESTDRTDFSEFNIPFDIKDGVVSTDNTSLVSPVLRIKATGKADLPKDSLDFRIEPTFVKTLKGQGDTEDRSGITVPVLVKGTLTEPKFSPDVSGIAKKAIEKEIDKGVEKGLDKILDKVEESGKSDETKDAVKGLLKGLLGK